MDTIKNYLGIDWGSADIGVALAHGETRIALSYATLHNDQDILENLGRIIVSENIGIVVIGIPSYTNREEVKYPGEKFGELLLRHFPVEVAYQDEMFTTKMAQANLIERGMKQVSQHDDEEAARIILSTWLDKKKADKQE